MRDLKREKKMRLLLKSKKKKKNDFFSDLEKGQNEMLDMLKN